MPRRAATTTAEGTTHLLRALLRPTLHRDIELESTDTLHTLAWGITRAFDFGVRHGSMRQPTAVEVTATGGQSHGSDPQQ